MPMPSALKTWLDSAYDVANGKTAGNKKEAQRTLWNGAELKAIFNLDAASKTDELLVVRIRMPAP